MFFSTWKLKCSADSRELPTRIRVKASIEDLQIFSNEVLTATSLIQKKDIRLTIYLYKSIIKAVLTFTVKPEMASLLYETQLESFLKL